MSYVINVLLVCSEEDEAMVDLHQWFLKNHLTPLENIAPHASGNKVFERQVWAGAYSGLDDDELSVAFSKLNFEYPEVACLLLFHPEDQLPRMVKLNV